MSIDRSGEGLPTPAPLGETQKAPKPPGWNLGENRLRSFLDGLKGHHTPATPNIQTPQPSEPVLPKEALPPPPNTRLR